MKVKVAVLSRDGEIVEPARLGLDVLKKTGQVFGHRIDIQRLEAADEKTCAECTKSDAVVIGSLNIEQPGIEELKKRLGAFARIVPRDVEKMDIAQLCDTGKKIQMICPGIDIAEVISSGGEAVVKANICASVNENRGPCAYVGTSGIDIHHNSENSVRAGIISSIMLLRYTLDMRDEADALETALAAAIEKGIDDGMLAGEVMEILN